MVDRSFDRARAARACSLIGGKAAYIGEKRGGAAYIGEKRGGGGLYRGERRSTALYRGEAVRCRGEAVRCRGERRSTALKGGKRLDVGGRSLLATVSL